MSVQQEWFEKNYYDVLGVSETASQKEITSAYRKLARQFHPDANPGDTAAEDRFKDISAAYDVIGDPEKRKQYDEVRRMGPLGGFGPGGGGFGPGTFNQGGMQFEGGDISDLIGNLFSRGRAGGPQTRQGPRRGDDIETDLHLSFDEALSGVTTTVHTFSDVKCTDCGGSGAAPGTSPRQCPECHGAGVSSENQGFFSFSRTCSTCGGRGVLIDSPCQTCHGNGTVQRSRAVKVKIPHGVRDGQRIRVKGKGGAGSPGAPDGDLYVRVSVAEHPIFKRQGDNLTMAVPVTFPEAALGANISVPTPQGGSVTLRIPPGTKSGRTFRVRGQGVATAKGNGDLHVTVEIVVPQHLNDEERAALESFAAASTESPRDYLEVQKTNKE